MVVVGTVMEIAMSTKKFFERVLKVAIAVVELLCAGGPCSVGRRYFLYVGDLSLGEDSAEAEQFEFKML